MRTKTITRFRDKALRLFLALLVATCGLMWLTNTSKAYADTGTIEHSGEWLDFYQYDSNTGNTWHDEIFTINGEYTFCIDIETSTVAGAWYWSESMDPDMALRIGLYDRYMQEAYSSWGYLTRYGYLQFMIWCEYSPGYVDAYVTPEPSDFWDVYAGAKAYYEQNKDNFEAWGTEWHSDESQNVCIMPRLIELGSVELTKTSGSVQLTDGNGCYSLAGAVYGIYYDSGCSDLAASMTTDADGYARADHLRSGDYWVKEVSPSPGYALDENAYPVTVSAGQTATVNGGTVEETAKSDPVGMLVAKADADLGGQPQGAASLEGAEFTISFYKGQYPTAADAEASGEADRTWVLRTDADGFCYLADGYKVSGPEFYYQSNGTTPTLPLGTAVIQETKAPEGYVLDDGAGNEPKKFCIQITDDGAMGESVYTFNTPESADSVMRGGVDVRKIDAETGDIPQGDATLAGATLDIVNLNENPVVVDGASFAKDEVCKTITVVFDEETGSYVASCRDCLPYGSYEIHESEAPEGYLLASGWTQEFSIEDDGDVADLTADAKALSDDVIRGGVRVEKDDLELGKSEAIGGNDHASTEGACLAGIEFTVTNESENAVMVEGELIAVDAVAATIETVWSDELKAYVAETSADMLPYGTYTIRETATNGSYLLTDGEPRTFQIREEGAIVEADAQGAELVFSDQVIRNDMELSKKADDTNSAIQAAFLITNTETGEAHVLVCDRNGDASTATSWNPHTRNTNANDKLAESETVKASDYDTSAGIWFGLGEDGSMAEPDDGLGAMPYGHYTLKELRSDSNAGYELVERELWIARDTTVARAVWMSLDDQPSERIHTQAVDAADGDFYVDAVDQVTVKDTVFYENLRTDGREYTVEGTLMVKSENAPLLDADGNLVTASKTFKPMTSTGTVELEFTFDASLLAGETVVVFEDLLQDGKLVATHADINDEGQSVKVVRICTTATNEAGGKTVTGSTAAIVDVVEYEGLTPGETYTLKAVLMDAETGKPVQREGGLFPEDVTAETEFTAEAASGKATVTLECDVAELGGHHLVVFEELYGPDGGKVTEHKDLEDEGQTVTVVSIRTTATDAADGDHVIESGKVKIVDVVEYKGLTPGEAYTMNGTLMAKSTGEALIGPDGEPVTATVDFRPENADGTVEMTFEFDGSKLAEGTELVVFEECLDANGNIVAEHKDLEDEGQTVVVDNPETPEKPTPSLPKTGDSVPWIPVACLAGAAACAAGIAVLASRRKNELPNHDPSEE